MERPKSGIQKKNTPEDNAKKVQRLFITWITDEPSLYQKVEKYISAQDFTEDLYREVADKLFCSLREGGYNPAAIISSFEGEEEQREAAALFNTKLEAIETKQDREKAFHDILYAVKKNSYDYYSKRMGTDVEALNKVIEGKKALEELSKTHISID